MVMPTFRQPGVLLLTLQDLAAQDYPCDLWELVVLDDGSRDISALLAVAGFRDDVALTVRREANNSSYSHSALFNRLLSLSDEAASVIVHVEDARLPMDYISQHVKWHGGSELRLVTGPMCESACVTFDPAFCSRWELMRSGGESDAYICSFQAIFAKSMSYSKALALALNESGSHEVFDERMTGWGYHETEFAYRALRAGAECIYDVKCGVYHPAHDSYDEERYRAIMRPEVRKLGERQNIQYLCEKHNLARLPEWGYGIPVPSPELPALEG